MNKLKTLVILSPGFPASKAESTCIPPQQVFVKALKENNPELNIVVLAFQYPFTAARYEWHGVKVIAFGGKNKSRHYRLITWLRVWFTLRQINRIHEVAGLLSFWLGECALIGSTFARRYRLRHYCWLLGQDARKGNRYVGRVRPHGKSLIALSDKVAMEFQENYSIQPKHIIPPGIDTSLFGPPVTERDIDIMGAGSLITLKQYHLFIEVVKVLTLSFPKLKTVICGKGPEMEQLKSQVSRLGIENNIKLKGELPHAEVLALMQRSRIFLHTSAYEGFGMVMSEALYAAAHVVSLVSPMNEMPDQHHLADKPERLPGIIGDLLRDPRLVHEQVLVYPVSAVAAEIAALFSIK